MVYHLAAGHATTRTQAYNLAQQDPACRGASLESIRKNVRNIWALAGLGAYIGGVYAYDVWTAYGW